MTKSQFKKNYSSYRKNATNNLCFGLDVFSSALDSNTMFRGIKLSRHEKPVSIKIYLYLNN